jgi:hypothetical protein
MRALDVICVSYFLVSSGSWHKLAAQEPAPRNQLTLDASILAGGVSYGRMTSSDKLVGAGAGVGTEFDIRLVRGEKWGKTSLELAHVEMFTRLEKPGRWQYDLGLKAAADIHSQAVHGQSGPVRWDLAQLDDWLNVIIPRAYERRAVMNSGISRMHNRISLGVGDSTQRRRLTALLASLEVPCYLVSIDRGIIARTRFGGSR